MPSEKMKSTFAMEPGAFFMTTLNQRVAPLLIKLPSSSTEVAPMSRAALLPFESVTEFPATARLPQLKPGNATTRAVL